MSRCQQIQYELCPPPPPCDSLWYLVFLNIQDSPLRLHFDIWVVVFVVVRSLSCVWLFCHPVDQSLPASSVHGTSQARILEWVAISFSRASSWLKNRTHICTGRQILYHWATVAYQELIPGSQWPGLLLQWSQVAWMTDWEWLQRRLGRLLHYIQYSTSRNL